MIRTFLETAHNPMEGEADGNRPHWSALVQEQRKQRCWLRGNCAPPRGGSRGPRFEGPQQDPPRLQPARMGMLAVRREERGIRPPGHLGLSAPERRRTWRAGHYPIPAPPVPIAAACAHG